MSYTKEIRRNAREIRERLRRPPNAVQDPGINITRKSSGVKGDYIPITPEIAPESKEEKPLPKLSPVGTLPLTFDRIIRSVALHYGLIPDDLKASSRRGDISRARWVAIYLGVRLLKRRTLASMARELKKDHTSVLYARDKIKDRLLGNHELAFAVESLEAGLRAEYHH